MADLWISGWSVFFSTLFGFLRESELTECPNEARLRSLINEIEVRLSSLIKMYNSILDRWRGGEANEHEDIEISEVVQKMECLIESISSVIIPSLKGQLELFYRDDFNGVVRNLEFTEDQLLYLRSLGFKWAQIADIFGTSRMTIYRRRRDLGLLNEDRFLDISDLDLKDLVLSIKNMLPDCGERMVLGFLRSKGLFVRRCQLRRIIHEVDPVNTPLRWHSRVMRRPYSVPGPMSLWHIGR